MSMLKTLVFFGELIKIVFGSSGAVVKLPLEVTHTIWFHVWFEKYDWNIGIVQFGLFGNMYPKIVRNFVELANVTKIGAGYKGSRLYVNPDYILGGYFEGGECTIYGRYYKSQRTAFQPYGQGWLFVFCLSRDVKYTSHFGVSLTKKGPPLDRTFGKVIRGMDVIKSIEALYPVIRQAGRASPLYILDCGVEIPYKKFYISKHSAPDFS